MGEDSGWWRVQLEGASSWSANEVLVPLENLGLAERYEVGAAAASVPDLSCFDSARTT